MFKKGDKVYCNDTDEILTIEYLVEEQIEHYPNLHYVRLYKVIEHEETGYYGHALESIETIKKDKQRYDDLLKRLND